MFENDDDDWLAPYAPKSATPEAPPLVDRLKGAIFGQESRGNYNVHPNQRTKATGGYQVLPGNIPNWTKKHLGTTLTTQQFAADPDAQDKVFKGEIGEYVNRARQLKPDADENTLARMAAAAWYGGPGAMHKYDNPRRFRSNEPSFREYTNSVLKRMGPAPASKPSISVAPKPDLTIAPGEDEAGQNAARLDLIAKGNKIPVTTAAQNYGMRDADFKASQAAPAEDDDWLAAYVPGNAQEPPVAAQNAPVDAQDGQTRPRVVPGAPMRPEAWETRYAKPNWQESLTKLSPDEEMQFQNWAKQNKAPITDDYDMRGFWKAQQSGNPGARTGVDPNDKQLHFPDTFKTPLHKSFSRESQFANPDAPEWNNRDQLVDQNGMVRFDDRAANAPTPAPADVLGQPQGTFSPGAVAAAQLSGEVQTREAQRRAEQQRIAQRNERAAIARQQAREQQGRRTGQDAAYARGKFGQMTREQRGQAPPSAGPDLLGQPSPQERIVSRVYNDPAARTSQRELQERGAVERGLDRMQPNRGPIMREGGLDQPTPIENIAAETMATPAARSTPEELQTEARRQQVREEIRRSGSSYTPTTSASLAGPGVNAGLEAEVDRRIHEQDAETARQAAIRTRYTPEDIQRIGSNADFLMEHQDLSRAGVESADSLTARAAVMAAGALSILNDLPATAQSHEAASQVQAWLERQGLKLEDAVEIAQNAKPKTTREEGLKLVTDLGLNLPIMGGLATIAGPETAFGVPAFLESKGRGQGYLKSGVEGAKQAGVGRLFHETAPMPFAQRVGSTAAGTLALDAATGTPPSPENLGMNVAFSALGGSKKPAERAPLTPRPELPEMPQGRSTAPIVPEVVTDSGIARTPSNGKEYPIIRQTSDSVVLKTGSGEMTLPRESVEIKGRDYSDERNITPRNPPAASVAPPAESAVVPRETPAATPKAAAEAEPSERRQWETKLGVVTEAADQTGVPEGYRKVVKPDGQDGMLRWADVEKGRAKEIGTDEPLNFAPRKAVSASPEGVTLEDGTVVPHIWRPDAEIAPATPQTAAGESVHPIRPDIATTPLPPETAAGVDNRQRLLDLGYSEAEISSMKPRQQANIAGAGQRKGEAAPPVAGNEKLTPEVRQQLTDAGYREQEISQMTPDRAIQALEFVKELDQPRTEKRLEERRQTTSPVTTERRIGPRRGATGPRVEVDGKSGTIAATEGGLATVKLDDGGTIVVGERGLKPLKEAPAEPLPTAPVQGDAAKPSEPPRPTEPPKPRNRTQAAQLSRRTVVAAVKGEKVSARTGLTPTQTEFVAGKLSESAGQLPVKDADLDEFGRKPPLEIKVPGDGEFVVKTQEAANKLHQRITGQPIEGMEKVEGGSVPASTAVRVPQIPRGKPTAKRQTELELEQKGLEALQKGGADAETVNYYQNLGKSDTEVPGPAALKMATEQHVRNKAYQAETERVRIEREEQDRANLEATVRGVSTPTLRAQEKDLSDHAATLNERQKQRLELTRAELAKRESPAESLKPRDTVSKGGIVGKVYDRNGKLRVQFEKNGKSQSEALSDKWTKARNAEAGAIDPGLLTLGIGRTVTDDVAPAARAAARTVVESADDIAKLVLPQARGAGARAGAGLLRKELASAARSFDVAKTALKTARDYFKRSPVQDNYEFIGHVEGGDIAKLPAVEQPMATELRGLLDKARKEVQDLGTGKLEDFIENYFPHIWEQESDASKIFGRILGRRPFEGPKSFLKKRTMETFKDGLDAGLKPISDNPVDLTLLKIREMNRYIAAHRVLNAGKESGYVKFVRIGGDVPDGWKKINDKISSVVSRNEDGEMVMRGSYYADPGFAQIVNNHLSPGLRDRSSAYRAWLAAGNALNQAQLGVSAFHLGFTSVDAMVSKFALAIMQATEGHPIKAAKSALGTPFAPITNIFRGDKILREWSNPGSVDPLHRAIADFAEQAGARAKLDDFYHTRMAEKMAQAIKRGNVLGAAARAPLAAVDVMSKPIMEGIVPRQKFGIFADLAKHEIARLGPDATPEQLRHSMQRIWDSVDNRMGQMVYDNLFWNRVVKDLAMGSVRSVGWNLGTFRELGGAAKDVVTLPGRVRRTMRGDRSDPVVTERMAYAAALPVVAGVLGATIQYLFTGEGPKELKDYYFPRTGNLDENGKPERMSLPSYAKDVYAYGEHPILTLEHKLHPMIGLIAETLENKDYYNTKIRNEDDLYIQQLKDVALHAGESITPFAIRGAMKESERGGTLTKKVLPFVGLTPAPADVESTDAEELAGELIGERMPPGARTKEAAEKSKLIRQLVREKRLGHDVDEQITKAKDAGLLSDRNVKDINSRSKRDYLQNAVNRLSAPEAIKVFEVASTPERTQIRDMVQKKIRRAQNPLKPAEKERAKSLGLAVP